MSRVFPLPYISTIPPAPGSHFVNSSPNIHFPGCLSMENMFVHMFSMIPDNKTYVIFSICHRHYSYVFPVFSYVFRCFIALVHHISIPDDGIPLKDMSKAANDCHESLVVCDVSH